MAQQLTGDGGSRDKSALDLTFNSHPSMTDTNKQQDILCPYYRSLIRLAICP